MENMKTKFRQIKDAWDQFQREEEMKTNYRKRTKVVAYFHIFGFSILFGLLMMAFFGATFLTPLLMGDEVPKVHGKLDADLQKLEEMPQGAKNAFVSCMWFGVVALGFDIVLQLLAALNLLNATEMGVTPIQAMEKIRFWRNATVVFTILDFSILVIVFNLWLVGGILTLARMASLSDVAGYTRALEREATAQANAEAASPPEIVTKH